MSRNNEGELNFGQRFFGGLIGANANIQTNSSSHTGTSDPHVADLLAGVLALREDLGRVRSSPEAAHLDEVLAGVEDEITGTGQVGPDRLARLRHALEAAGAVADLLASAAAVRAVIEVLAD
ncbi:hypothetical protein ACFY8O_33310 [Streptomyces argenteolus]|uniref:Uncharacterized protein n=1 Tax=Streptomyces argenteolus TaxID=67274 RepID=A0ABW6XG88_9ACTN